MESYKLEDICQEELKHGKRKMIVDSHDEMYFKHLREYVLYNLEDVERVYELEQVKNYLQFEYELCNVCNISWDQIYSKTRLIDGLVYNYAWDNHKTLIVEGPNNEFICRNIKDELYRDLVRYMSEYNISEIDDGKVSIRDYAEELRKELEIAKEEDDDDDKGYEGAVVLKPQVGVHSIVADLDASQMYPRLMIRSNIFKDTLCGCIAIRNEEYAEKWLYNRDAFPNEILVKEHNMVRNKMLRMSKYEFEEYLKDKILTPFGTIYWKPEVKRSLISNILFSLIDNRSHYKTLMKDAIGQLGTILKSKKEDDPEVVNLKLLINRYDNLQNVYKQVINSFYGVMGLFVYRLANIFSAASITSSGRELTRIVSCYASRYMDKMIYTKNPEVPFDEVPLDCKTLEGLEDIENRRNIIYGDTDSAFLWMGPVVDAIYGSNVEFDKKIEYAWNLIERVSQYINQYVIKEILERKGIDFNDSDSSYNYEYKKELVMSKTIFTNAKKGYAYHLVIREGKRLDEINMKGISAVKSDTPRFSRDIVNKVVNYILTDYDSENVRDSNNVLMNMYTVGLEEAKKYISEGNILIARPVSISKDYSSYKNIQSSLRGMMIYDLLYDHEFTPGSKGYQFDLSSIDLEKLGISKDELRRRFKKQYKNYSWCDSVLETKDDMFFGSITIPSEVEHLDTSIFIIDEPKTLKNIMKQKVKNILSVVGLDTLDDEDVQKKRKSKLSRSFSFDEDIDEDVIFSI